MPHLIILGQMATKLNQASGYAHTIEEGTWQAEQQQQANALTAEAESYAESLEDLQAALDTLILNQETFLEI